MGLINKNIKDSKDEEIKKRKINNSMIKVSSRNDNLKLIEMKMKMKDILSHPLSNNHKKIDKNYNKNTIDFILKKRMKNLFIHLIKVLKML